VAPFVLDIGPGDAVNDYLRQIEASVFQMLISPKTFLVLLKTILDTFTFRGRA
jgi:hypothetical protein